MHKKILLITLYALASGTSVFCMDMKLVVIHKKEISWYNRLLKYFYTAPEAILDHYDKAVAWSPNNICTATDLPFDKPEDPASRLTIYTTLYKMGCIEPEKQENCFHMIYKTEFLIQAYTTLITKLATELEIQQNRLSGIPDITENMQNHFEASYIFNKQKPRESLPVRAICDVINTKKQPLLSELEKSVPSHILHQWSNSVKQSPEYKIEENMLQSEIMMQHILCQEDVLAHDLVLLATLKGSLNATAHARTIRSNNISKDIYFLGPIKSANIKIPAFLYGSFFLRTLKTYRPESFFVYMSHKLSERLCNNIEMHAQSLRTDIQKYKKLHQETVKLHNNIPDIRSFVVSITKQPIIAKPTSALLAYKLHLDKNGDEIWNWLCTINKVNNNKIVRRKLKYEPHNDINLEYD